MANFWTKNNGDSLITLQEQVTMTPLPLPLSQAGAAVTLISGSLPAGTRLSGTNIVGTPREVSRELESTFVLRATYNDEISDRTFKITVLGADAPEWQTPADLLAAGNNSTYYILDNSPIDFQLEVIDTDTAAGQVLEYYIGSRGGVLPPGIKLTKDGRLVGVVDPILAIEKAAGTGSFDQVGYDFESKSGYDWSVPSANGFDSFFYDTTIYDLSTPTKSPKKLNRFYEFTVSVSDGDTVSSRTFRLLVVGDDFFRSDTTLMQIGTNIFTADNTHIRVPIWLTPRNLGYRRANNYVTLVLDIIDPNTILGVTSYYLTSLNDDNSASTLPPGLVLDTTTGEIAGRVPYQPNVTKEYKFTVAAKRVGYDIDTVQLIEYMYESANVGVSQIKTSKFDTYSQYVLNKEFTVDGNVYKVTGINTNNALYDVLTLNRPTLTTFNKTVSINFGTISIVDTEDAISTKTFVVNLLGEVNSTITWDTASNLGSFSSNYISTLKISATTSVPNANLIYTVSQGSLPPGLRLSLDGEIIGKVRSYGSGNTPGLTIFDSQNLKLDNNETKFDRTFKFTANVQDQYGYSNITREFTVTLSDPDSRLYSNVYLEPMLKQSQRNAFSNFVNNTEIFLPEYLYRPNDPSFGIQTKIKILSYAGIESKTIDHFIAAAAKNHIRRNYQIGEIKTAVAKKPGTQEIAYEVVYLEVIDPKQSTKINKKVKPTARIKNKEKILVNSSKYTVTGLDTYDSEMSELSIQRREDPTVVIKFIDQLNVEQRDNDINIDIHNEFGVIGRDGLSDSIAFIPGVIQSTKYRPDPENTITTDSNAIKIDGESDRLRYISNMTHMRDAIRSVGATEKNFLPLWMRSGQETESGELGFVNAIPLCFCKEGKAKIIKNNIEQYNIDFKQFDLDIDRYVIDSTEGNSDSQYIVFANYKFNV